MSKIDQLEKIIIEIQKCRECKIGKSGLAVPGEGNPDADIVFVGEAPGRKESEEGRPFIGRSGQLLRSLITSIGLSESDVFITSPVKYLPDRGTPNSEEIKHGMAHLNKQLEIISPKLVVLLGRVAAEGVLQSKISVLKEHGKIIEKKDTRYFLTLHPAAVIRFKKYKNMIEEDFEKIKKITL
jgi:uracil-DNA glycosylase